MTPLTLMAGPGRRQPPAGAASLVAPCFSRFLASGLSRFPAPGLSRFLAPGLSLFLALSLAACGSDNDEANQPTPPPAGTPSPPAAPPPGTAPPARGSLLEAVGSATLDTAALDQNLAAAGVLDLAGPSRCQVEIVAIRYQSIGPHGEAVELTGAAMLPFGDACLAPFPVVSYSRGTDLQKSRTMADPANFENGLVAAMLAGRGIAVVASDYLGYAGSTWPRHPYLHADSEASAAIDALRALGQLASSRQLVLEAGVHAIGYSQGGHASLATQGRLEQLTGEFQVLGGAHLSGPHDLPAMAATAIDEMPLGGLGSTYYIPFALTGLQGVYGDLYSTPADFFRWPYAATIETLFPGEASVTDLLTDGKLPLLFSQLVTDGFVTAARDPASGLSRALAANVSWSPAALKPTLFCGGSRDAVVPFQNSLTAAATLRAAGGDATIIDVEEVAAWREHLPSPLVPVNLLASYHARDVPPLCLLAARQGLPALAVR